MLKHLPVIRRRTVSAAAAAFLWLLAGRPAPAAGDPTFTYSLSPASFVIAGEPGTAFRRDLEIVLTTADNPTADGVTGWSWSLAAEGVTVIDATVQGTVAARTTDDPPGLVRPDAFGVIYLASHGVKDCEGRPGAVGAAVLNLRTHVALPAEGSAVVARITIAGEVPSVPGEVSRPRLLFVEGCVGQGTGVYTGNGITWQSTTHFPATAGCDLEVRAVGAQFRRGDATDDGIVNIADAVFILHCKYLDEPCPECRDAADVNDDGLVDISDPIHLLGFLFLGGEAPRLPGILCGSDPTEDDFPACIYKSCSGPP